MKERPGRNGRAFCVRPLEAAYFDAPGTGRRPPSICMTLSTGTANPMFCAPGTTARLTPTSSPSMFSSAPPLLPGLMEASVCRSPEQA